VLCRGGSAGRPLGAPEPASRPRPSAPCSPLPTCPSASSDVPPSSTHHPGRGTRAGDPRLAARSHRRPADVAARALRPAPRLSRGAHPAGRGALERRDRAARSRGRRARVERALGGAAQRRGRDETRPLGPRPRAAHAAPRPRPGPAGRRARGRADGAHGRAGARRLREHGRGRGSSPAWCRWTRPCPGSSRTGARWRRRRDRRRWGRAHAWTSSTPRTASARGRSSPRRGSTRTARGSALHASGGRPVKQWAAGRWREVAQRLQREFGAGPPADRAPAADRPLGRPAVGDRAGRCVHD
jgi:hypothetical protein